VSSLEELINTDEMPKELPRRLCSEIQLFDLCELEKCHFKDDRFCTDPEMLARFEAAAEPEDRPVWHLGKDEDQDEDDLFNFEEFEGDDDESDDFDGGDRSEQDSEW
jgi:hypothetical protein